MDHVLMLLVLLWTSDVQAEGKSSLPECTKATLADIVFLVDSSSSVSMADFQEIRLFLRIFISTLDIGPDKVRIGLAQYSDESYQEVLLKDHLDKQSLLAEVDKLRSRMGHTETGKATDFLLSQYFTEKAGSRASQRVPQIAVIITDGSSTDDIVIPAQRLRQHGVIVFGIGVGQVNLKELESIANQPSHRFLFTIDRYQALQGLAEGLLSTVCITMEDERLALAEKFADIFFLMDSGVIAAEFQQIRTILIRLANQLNIGASAHRLGLAQYGHNTSVTFLLNAFQTKAETLNGIRRLRQQRRHPNEPRNLGAALQYARMHFFTSEVGSREDLGFKQFLVVLSGKDSDSPTGKQASLLKSEGVTVVGMSLGASMHEMRLISTVPYAYQSLTNAVPTLKSIFEKEEAIHAEGCKSANPANIVFIVDESGSIGAPNFQLVRTFLHSIVSSLHVSPCRVRVGIVTYSERPVAQVYLNNFNDKNELLMFIKILPYRGGGTNTGAALKFTKENIFIEARGSRKEKGVQQVAVVLTDGVSQDNVIQEAASLRRTGVTVYPIGVKDANETQLVEVASYPPNKHTFFVDSFAKLKSLEQSLKTMLCQNIIHQAVSSKTRFAIKEGCTQMDEADIFFLIDDSGSISRPDFSDMKKFIIEFLHTFYISPQHVRIGVVKYADDPSLEFDLTTYTDAETLEKAVLQISHLGGGTETGKALAFMGPYFDRAEVTRGYRVSEYLVVITDGKSLDEVQTPAEQLRAQGVIVYAIGVNDADVDELQTITSDRNRAVVVNNFDALKPVKDIILTDICSTDACRHTPGDLFFLIDSSGSISAQDYNKMKDFMKSFINKSMIGEEEVHIGVMQFSSSYQIEFPLNRYYSKEEMFRAIDGMSQIGGGTNTGSAIRGVSQYFDSAYGGRPDLRQMLVMITDGVANDEVDGPARALRAKGVVIFTIGVAYADTTQLLEISGTLDNIYIERDFDTLKDLETEMAMKICERGCKKIEKADIIFLVDGSSNITQSKFRSMQKFMESIVNQTRVGKNLTHFGVILFSTDPQSVFTLNEYVSRRNVSKAISELRKPYGDTYTGKALTYSLQFFDAKHGGRAELQVPQILIVITDGDATDHKNLVEPSVALRENRVSIVSIGVEGANRTQLEIMTGQDTSKVFYVDNFDGLKTLHNNITQVLCNAVKPGSVRLQNGSNQCSGRLEVKFTQNEQQWFSVCKDDFDLLDAKVACRELGCGATPLIQEAVYEEAEAPMWTKQFRCGGHEFALEDCGSPGSAGNSCFSGKAVNLTCSEPVRLVGGASRCAGRLEIKQHGKWKPVSGHDWSEKTADVFCEHLDCGFAVSVEKRESLRRPVWSISLKCVQSRSGLRECAESGYSSSIINLTCSDVLLKPTIAVSSVDGVSKTQQQGLQVFRGSPFTINCSIQPQYPGGSFQLTFTSSNTSYNATKPAVNHSAHFLFPVAKPAHQGNYSCVYELYFNSHNLSSKASLVSVSVSDPTGLIIRAVVVPLTLPLVLLVPALCFYCKASRGQRPGKQEIFELVDYNLGVGAAGGGTAEEDQAQEAELISHPH